MRNEQYLKTIAWLQNSNEGLKKVAENSGIIRMLRSVANDLGIAFDWIGLYFIVALIWRNGQTPGLKALKNPYIHR